MRNRGYEYRERLDRRADGRQILDYLANRYRHSSPSDWRGRIAQRRVQVDGAAVAPDQILRRGQVLTWRRPAWDEPDAPRSFAVLFKDSDLLAVAKPSGLPTMPGGGFLENTLLAVVREYDPGAVPLHRLGRGTSGLVLFARTGRARSKLARAWRERRVVKRYLALASGRPERREFDVSTPIGTVAYAPLGRLHASSPAGKASLSHVIVKEQRTNGFVAEVTIETGRPHQILIHMAAAGHPLVGDPLYGTGGIPRTGTRSLPGDPGYLLHASTLIFEHPTTRTELSLSCAPPPSLRTVTPG